MALALNDVEAIGSDHRERTQNCLADVFFGVGMNDYKAALLAVFKEGVAGEAFAGFAPLHRLIIGGEFVDPLIEEGRLDAGGTGGVGVGFCSDVDATCAGIGDEFEEPRGCFVAARIDVNDVEFCAGDGCGGDDFAEAEFAIGESAGGAGGAAHVDVATCAIFGGDAEHVDDFTVGGTVSVGDSKADGGSTESQAFFDAEFDGFALFGSCCLTGGGTGGEEVTFVEHDGHARGGMTDRRAVVVVGFALALGVIFGDVGDADFEFESAGDAVHQLIAATGEVDAVPVEVNEAGGKDESGAVDFGASFERCFAYGGDFAGGDGDVANGVEATFGVENACGSDYQIMWGLGEQAEGQEQANEIAHQGERIAF